MKAKAGESSSANELQLELKYCERCGGLWLRPVGGGQVYCVACGREMAKMPAASHDRTGNARVPEGPTRWNMDESDFDDDEEYDGLDLDASGGVA
jgi:Zn-finger nucleic acid-binding protein